MYGGVAKGRKDRVLDIGGVGERSLEAHLYQSEICYNYLIGMYVCTYHPKFPKLLKMDYLLDKQPIYCTFCKYSKNKISSKLERI